ncbi:uroporphyrinogen-III C-methyltransferase [Aeromicrobium sp. 636]|uniref:Uroporphyrinogen-III C-methyltransferase n=1 Tax=Aeromicrobium senzhongii TaxID=2663859 RepID=A0A8I0K1X0_9ACTN|nr:MULTISPECIES: uroporphyrinogen-III C-methyltransferase [Aeromicrobium]MBC9225070.1 uroporphyrinogen-III C-methyltransferase [Aeromicrobium senzhongii]MCQ3997180.1 uroporphyrinogen-III C-methyltransferase [Aeromicrobium sp. 636]MTB87119.1 uroporphyrinogen-III C-methyltransferase [Aeromicrobium senzhongii]QNL93067.1 uroporphyrinogen-III C-methyltransferase [Aeromicrobium senzhongii]
MSIFPLGLRLEGRRVVVVGGGHVATRRAFALVESGADVHVVSPAVSDSLASAIGRGTITWHERAYHCGDLDGAWLVQTATGVPAVDDLVADDAEARQIFCLKGGDPERATAWTPAVARVDDVTIAVSGGGDAGRASALRDALATALQTGDLPLRHRTHPRGLVALVGGGPGDPGLLTARGRRLLAEADVVVFDRLAPQSVLAELAADVEVIDVGKQPDHHPIPQEQINALLVDRAREGKVVVRLKGGDPYVFGRGGEELLACREAGIEVEVVPGVTSAIAVAAAAGIPVTHRGVARGFSVVTGHESLGELPRRGDHTLVMLMGVKRLRSTADELIAAGHDPETPTAVIERGFSPDQRTTIATLGTIADRASDAVSPAITVIGDVVSLAAATTGSVGVRQTS